ncbi:3-isopropylmalate dehydratase small subunit [Stenotrophomonas sp. 24(2023)]|uniref:3-isopropylmalate dehydratase small subunit n=1 Tax=Stenotrophomonas sp. 24(2023) TaxID=3068324 RepID=UPI0027DF3086|nr:3-isopropylmalate dehydratase small subunit [Stenotrophomonas sp. 24(2023)]WMJ68935.1 3-isopropylmalate dehydratase small subunit [Stenotrophomonas sp. 24(2023)]
MNTTNDAACLHGHAAMIDIANLDTDQIMPKQFLRGIDKAGLAQGLLYDLRFDGDGQLREDFVLNRPAFAGTDVLLAASNFGCGSSREHAVWGLQQYGIRAVIASSFGEIFYSNAMNNRLLLAMVAEADAQHFMQLAREADAPLVVEIDVAQQQVRCGGHVAAFTLSDRHRHMFLEGLDIIGASLAYRERIDAFAARHWQQHPWLQDVARRTRERLG